MCVFSSRRRTVWSRSCARISGSPSQCFGFLVQHLSSLSFRTGVFSDCDVIFACLLLLGLGTGGPAAPGPVPGPSICTGDCTVSQWHERRPAFGLVLYGKSFTTRFACVRSFWNRFRRWCYNQLVLYTVAHEQGMLVPLSHEYGLCGYFGEGVKHVVLHFPDKAVGPTDWSLTAKWDNRWGPPPHVVMLS